MVRTLLKSKIHRATVTDADLNYEGSVSIDSEIMRAADLLEYEQVDVYNVTTGARFTTYAIPAASGSGEIRINGAAAHLATRGDVIIIASYVALAEKELPDFLPRLVYVDHQNRITRTGAEMAPA